MTPFAPLLLAAMLAPAQAETPLTWKLKTGDVFYAKSVVAMKQTVMVLGNKVNQDQEQTTIHRYTIKSADKSGYKIEQKILKSEVKGNLPGAADVAKKMKGVTLTYTLTPTFDVTKMEGYDDFLTALVGDNAEVRKQVEAMLSEETLKTGVSELFGTTPNNAVKIGDTWKKDSKLSMGPVGDFKIKANYKYASASPDKVTWTAETSYTAPKAGTDGPFSITKGDLKSDKFEGSYEFDSKLGRIKSSTTKTHIKGKMTISVNNNEAEMELDQHMETTATISDKNLADD